MARTNKAERTAMNLTRIAATNGVTINSALSQELYELASDNGVAMFDGHDCSTFPIDHLVFIPQKIADEKFDFWKRFNDSDKCRYIDSKAFSFMVEHWCRKALNYTVNSGK